MQFLMQRQRKNTKNEEKRNKIALYYKAQNKRKYCIIRFYKKRSEAKKSI